MPDIEIKRGYEVLPDNNVRFGIRVINNSDFTISDVEVILDYSESLLELSGNKIQKLGNIPPTVPRTAKFVLKPLGCIHKEEISATIRYKDHQWKKHTIEMKPKEVHCVCPFLKEKSITRAEFLKLSNSGFLEERGVNFEGITVDKLVEFISYTCKNRLYKVDEFPILNGRILYLAGDALGEKAHYLLTAVVKEYEGLTQVLLRANSDKNYGLNGFLNEILDNLRHLVVSASAREIGIIKKEQVINIIDSVVQRSNFSISEGAPSVNVRESVVQRAEIKANEEKKKREEDRKLLNRQIEGERIYDEKKSQREREEEEKIATERVEGAKTSRNKLIAVMLLLGLLVLGYWVLAPGGNESIEPLKSTPSPTTTIISTPIITATALPTPMITVTVISTPIITATVSPTPIITPSSVREQKLYTSDLDEFGFHKVTVKDGSVLYNNYILTINAGDTVKWVSVTDNLYYLTVVSKEGLWNNSSSMMKYRLRYFNYTFDQPGEYEVYIKEFPRETHQKIVVNP